MRISQELYKQMENMENIHPGMPWRDIKRDVFIQDLMQQDPDIVKVPLE